MEKTETPCSVDDYISPKTDVNPKPEISLLLTLNSLTLYHRSLINHGVEVSSTALCGDRLQSRHELDCVDNGTKSEYKEIVKWNHASAPEAPEVLDGPAGVVEGGEEEVDEPDGV
ncbi:hypothetical protein Tco_1043315 [Tanacetum coccineum]|uniref:Uncharacterized protein n=1 Tax=Tanacetum coccineum TaxID=301880 RepID=A0ABQ5GMX5_9ASTR